MRGDHSPQLLHGCCWECTSGFGASAFERTLTLRCVARRAARPPRRDRLNVPRGPCSLPVLKEAWVNGVIDSNTLIWGQGLADFIPIRNVRTLVPQIRTLEGEWVGRLGPGAGRAGRGGRHACCLGGSRRGGRLVYH